MRRVGLLALCGMTVLTLLAGCGDDDDGADRDGGGDGGVALCTPAAISTALASAAPGSTVLLGSCRITGAFMVPASVTLQGAGAGKTVLVAPVDGVALTLVPGTTPSRVIDLTIESDGRAAVLVKGTAGTRGGAAIERVAVSVTRGVGVGAELVTGLTLSDVTITGNLEAIDAPTLPAVPLAADYPLYGLVAIGSEVMAQRLAVSKLVLSGAAFTNSTVTWTGGSACDNAIVGVRAHGGTLTMNDVTTCRTLQSGPNPGIALLFTGGAMVISSGVKAMDNERFGIVHVGSNGSHTDFVGMRNGDPAVWVEGSTSFELKGVGTLLVGNKFNALVVRDSSNVTVRDAMIADTVMLTRTTHEATGSPMMLVTNGDGIQFLRATASSIRDVRLVNNARTGLLFDVASGANTDVQLQGTVTVSGPGNGALMQNSSGMVAPGVGGWDNAVMRDSATMTRDVAVTTRLGTVGIGIISPQILPVPLSSLLGVRL